MKTKHHINLLLQGIVCWAAFWVLGLPNYYQQYSSAALGIGAVLLSVATSLAAVSILARSRPEHRVSRAFWISFYFTVPLAALDTWYCGIHLGHGTAYFLKYWYLTVFYLTPWLTFVPTAWLLNQVAPPKVKLSP